MADKEKKNVKKSGFFAKLGEKLKGLKSEFGKITWASFNSTFRNFLIVLVIVTISAAVIGLIDMGLKTLFDVLLKNLNF